MSARLGNPGTVRGAFDRFMYWTCHTAWPENVLVIQGNLKPVTPDLEPAGPDACEPAQMMRGIERSAGSVVELVTRLGWVWARHPVVTIGGEVFHSAGGTQAMFTRGEIEMAFFLDSLGDAVKDLM